MLQGPSSGKKLQRQVHTTIIHFDYVGAPFCTQYMVTNYSVTKKKLLKLKLTYTFVPQDCFYASVFENESPHLKTRPLAVQQKQIIVTCNYTARSRGLYKLQLVSEAKRSCPDVVIVLGEDLTRFRNASKELYAFLGAFSWNARCERLGFDEVFMDVSDIIDYNANRLNASNLCTSFFYLSKTDPTSGFSFDATSLAGHAYPELSDGALVVDTVSEDNLQLRLLLASHLAQYMRSRLEKEKGYTATVGISTNKVLAKLVGNRHKPNAQTTLLPPYMPVGPGISDNVTLFMDDHEIGKVPGVGFKIAQKLRTHVLRRRADFDTGLVYGGSKETVLVRDVRQHAGMGPGELERLLRGHGTSHGIGARIWELLNGCDSAPVGLARQVPTQISIEDSYLRLDDLNEVTKQLHMLGTSLLKRMHTDLVEDEQDNVYTSSFEGTSSKRWLAHPKTIRLSTRPRAPLNPNGSRNRSFARTSRSAPMPSFVFSFKERHEAIVERLVNETLLPLFRRLHPEKSGWNLSLVNMAAANMADAASEKGGSGRDISKMLKQQDDNIPPSQRRANHPNHPPEPNQKSILTHQLPHPLDTPLCLFDPQHALQTPRLLRTEKTGSGSGSEDIPTPSQQDSEDEASDWQSGKGDFSFVDSYQCRVCGALMPLFAMVAHERFHAVC